LERKNQNREEQKKYLLAALVLILKIGEKKLRRTEKKKLADFNHSQHPSNLFNRMVIPLQQNSRKKRVWCVRLFL
jgi:hypothetical protein